MWHDLIQELLKKMPGQRIGASLDFESISSRRLLPVHVVNCTVFLLRRCAAMLMKLAARAKESRSAERVATFRTGRTVWPLYSVYSQSR